jgi:hypothetical protein
MKWLDIVLHKMGHLDPQRTTYQTDIANIIKIVKHKLALSDDPTILNSLKKIVVDLRQVVSEYPIPLTEQLPESEETPYSEQSLATLRVQSGKITPSTIDRIETHLG